MIRFSKNVSNNQQGIESISYNAVGVMQQRKTEAKPDYKVQESAFLY